jgi:hypothetical protein
MVKQKSRLYRLSWPALVLLATGCAQPSVQPSRLPELPAQGRVSLVPIPSDCSPDCLSGLTRERNESANMLSGSALPGRFASDTPAVYSLPTGGKIKP